MCSARTVIWIGIPGGGLGRTGRAKFDRKNHSPAVLSISLCPFFFLPSLADLDLLFLSPPLLPPPPHLCPFPQRPPPFLPQPRRLHGRLWRPLRPGPALHPRERHRDAHDALPRLGLRRRGTGHRQAGRVRVVQDGPVHLLAGLPDAVDGPDADGGRLQAVPEEPRAGVEIFFFFFFFTPPPLFARLSPHPPPPLPRLGTDLSPPLSLLRIRRGPLSQPISMK